MALAAAGACAVAAVRADDLYLGSKQTYAPQQDASTCEAPPAGFAQVFGFHAASQDYAHESIVFTASGASTALSFFAFTTRATWSSTTSA